jgi:hypothetical protein
VHCKRVVEQAMTEDFLSKGLVIVQRRPRSDRRRRRTSTFLSKGFGEGYGLRCRGAMDDYRGIPAQSAVTWEMLVGMTPAGTTKRGRR